MGGMKTGIKNSLVALGLLAGSLAFANAAYFNTAPLTRCDVSIDAYLSYGQEGRQVTVLQNILARGGYLTAQPNGYFGPSTRAAVRAFQADNGISTSGVVGEATRNALNERACDSDIRGNGYSYDSSYDTYTVYSSPVTYVDPYDAYVKVVSPTYANPVALPVSVSNQTPTIAYTASAAVSPTCDLSQVRQIMSQLPLTQEDIYQTEQEYCAFNPEDKALFLVLAKELLPELVARYSTKYGVNTAPATTLSSGVASTNINYSPYVGYYYGATPATGSLTITNPIANALYNEGDVVSLSWYTNNIAAHGYTIILENTQTGLTKEVASVSGTASAASFVLTKETLDAVCAGTCSNSSQGSYRIVIATPMTDIAGTTSTFRAAVAPVTIKRPYSFFGSVSITTSKTPVASGELFKLFVNIPTGASWDANLYGNYSFKIRAICPSGVTASIAGAQCGQDFVLPLGPTFFQQEIPTMVANTSWYPQTVTYQITVTNLAGQVIGTASTNVSVNAAPFSW